MPTAEAKLPHWMGYASASAFCVCGEMLGRHTVEDGMMVRRAQGKLVCAGFYAHADAQRAHRIAAAAAKVRAQEAAQAPAVKKAKKAARKPRKPKKQASAFTDA